MKKSEGIALLPALDPADPRDFLLVITNDNDLITPSGNQISAAYEDASGADVDIVILINRIMLWEQRK